VNNESACENVTFLKRYWVCSNQFRADRGQEALAVKGGYSDEQSTSNRRATILIRPAIFRSVGWMGKDAKDGWIGKDEKDGWMGHKSP
jgi:hypothetical protein